MKYYAINGSPRKKHNTATLLQHALDGIQSAKPGHVIETELVHVYDLDFQPCVSCFLCKREGGASYGKCALKDGLTPLLEQLAQADGIIFGSPIYFGGITAKLRGFLERFMFQYLVYDKNYSCLAPKKMPMAFIYTMNVTESAMEAYGYRSGLEIVEQRLGHMFSPLQVMHAFNTYQFDDYTKYRVECFSEAEKADYKKRQFPLDCEKAFSIGAAMTR